MVFSQNDEEPNEEQFNVDGKYIPRIFFLGENREYHNNHIMLPWGSGVDSIFRRQFPN